MSAILRIPMTQAQRIVRKFGNARKLARALAQLKDEEYSTKNPSSVYRWMYAKENGGTGGIIPTRALPLVMRAARLEGIFLSREDLSPEVLSVDIK